MESRPPYEPRGSMISILGMLQWFLPPNYKDRDPMLCHAQLNNYDLRGFLIDLPHHEYQQIYNRHGLTPLVETVAINLWHINILTVNGCAIYGGEIVGLFPQSIKNKLSRYLFPGERYSRGADDLLPIESYYLPEMYLQPENKRALDRILIGYCRVMALAFAAELDVGFLTAPLTFDHLYLADDPCCNSLKVPILPCTGNPYKITDGEQFFVEPSSNNFSNYGAADISYNWARLAICVLLRGEPNFESFVFEDLIEAGIDDELLVTIRGCLDRDRNKRPTMKHAVTCVEHAFLRL